MTLAVGRAPDERAAFADWVRPHVAVMSRVAARLAPYADRDDIVQEALARAWVKRRQYDEARGELRAWLCAIAADQARKAVGRRRPAEASPPEQVAVANAEDRLDLLRALRQLTERQRLAVDCVYFVDLSVAEAAAVMRCSQGTVKSTLADARAKLRAILEVCDD
jgi:RNA polymerase sigma-70 factor (ECF subfamily)